MAAYGALMSLSHLLNHILNPPPLNKIVIPTEQIEFLRAKVDFFINLLESYPSRRIHEIEDLLMRITGAAYAAQDIIESNVLSQIRSSTQNIILKGAKEILPRMCGKMHMNADAALCENIQMVIERFVSIEEDLTKVKFEADLQPTTLTTTTLSGGRVAGGKAVMVGFKKYLFEIKDALASDVSQLQVISIVGMGGIGKTTLATDVYNVRSIVDYFHVRAWVTVSQQYTTRELLICLLDHLKKLNPTEKQCSDDEIGELLYKELFCRKYLIVMDDMWDVEAWDQVKRFFPDNDNGSRVLVTTRQSDLTVHFIGTSYKIDFLDKEHSWDLLCKTIFGEEECPVELEDTGKIIAERCAGLPLALVVIGGLLAKSERTREHWDSIARDIPSALRYGDDEHAMKILSLKDKELSVSELVRLWVAKGIIKPSKVKSLEEVAHEYFENLIGRNLILSHRWGSIGNVASCKIHDVVRNLCMVEAAKEKFLSIAKLDNPIRLQNQEAKRCPSLFLTSNWTLNGQVEVIQSAKFNRSIFSHNIEEKINQAIYGFKLLNIVSGYNLVDISKLNNLRYVVTSTIHHVSSLSHCWNLQTLVLSDYHVISTLPIEIWQMPQLRHLKIDWITLPDPPPADGNVIVLKNLQTLKRIKNLKLTEEVWKRIPNLKKLEIGCYKESCYSSKLVCFKKLESLRIYGADVLLFRAVTFPVSLKKLTLRNFKFEWEDMSIVGALPNLEVLKLMSNDTQGGVWNPIHGQFRQLKYLLIYYCPMKIWGAENYHFPCLEHLVLSGVSKLKRIPMSFAEILTLQVIELHYAMRFSLGRSARKISKERLLLGYEPLQLHCLRVNNLSLRTSNIASEETRSKVLTVGAKIPGVHSIGFHVNDGRYLIVIGDIDLERLKGGLRKVLDFKIMSYQPKLLYLKKIDGIRTVYRN